MQAAEKYNRHYAIEPLQTVALKLQNGGMEFFYKETQATFTKSSTKLHR